MKKLLLLIFAALTLTGCGTVNSPVVTLDSSGITNLQQQKELKVIKAQENKEAEILNQQHAIRVQEEQDRQTSIDVCLEKARQRQKETVNLLLKQLGLKYDVSSVAPERVVNDLSETCRQRFPQYATDCIKLNASYIKEAQTDYESDEANCYKRFQ